MQFWMQFWMQFGIQFWISFFLAPHTGCIFVAVLEAVLGSNDFGIVFGSRFGALLHE